MCGLSPLLVGGNFKCVADLLEWNSSLRRSVKFVASLLLLMTLTRKISA